jgi:hypothetical protein
MAQVEDALASGLTALGGATICGHATDQRITVVEEGKTFCGTCWQTYRELTTAYRAGSLDRAGLSSGLRALLATFTPPPPADLIGDEVADVITDLDADIAATPAPPPHGGP